MSTSTLTTRRDQLKPVPLERPSGLRNAIRRFVRTSRVGAISAGFLLLLLLVALFADQVAPYHPLKQPYGAAQATFPSLLAGHRQSRARCTQPLDSRRAPFAGGGDCFDGAG
ncbi:MAG: hypothetical protein R2932_34880 [Caldilineaceae bacterium]